MCGRQVMRRNSSLSTDHTDTRWAVDSVCSFGDRLTVVFTYHLVYYIVYWSCITGIRDRLEVYIVVNLTQWPLIRFCSVALEK